MENIGKTIGALLGAIIGYFIPTGLEGLPYFFQAIPTGVIEDIVKTGLIILIAIAVFGGIGAWIDQRIN